MLDYARSFGREIGPWWWGMLTGLGAFPGWLGWSWWPLPPLLFVLLAQTLVLIGAFRAYAKVARERDDLKPDPVDLMIRTTTALKYDGLTSRYSDDWEESVVLLQVSVTNRGTSNVSLEFDLQTFLRFEDEREVFSMVTRYSPSRIPKELQHLDSWLTTVPALVTARGETLTTELCFSITPIQAQLLSDRRGHCTLIVRDLFNDQEQAVPLEMFRHEDFDDALRADS